MVQVQADGQILSDVTANSGPRTAALRFLVVDRIRQLLARVAVSGAPPATALRVWATPPATCALLIGAFIAWGSWGDGTVLAVVGLTLVIAGPLGLLTVLTLVPSKLEVEALELGRHRPPRLESHPPGSESPAPVGLPAAGP